MKVENNMQSPRENWWVGVKLECRTCDSTITLEEGDKLVLMPDRWDTTNEYFEVLCPVCGKYKMGTSFSSVESDRQREARWKTYHALPWWKQLITSDPYDQGYYGG